LNKVIERIYSLIDKKEIICNDIKIRILERIRIFLVNMNIIKDRFIREL